MIDMDIISEAIEDGEVHHVEKGEGGRHTAVIRYEWLNSHFEVVVEIEDPVVVSAYDLNDSVEA
jgi:hypothetical protein